MSLLERNSLPVRPSRQFGESLPGYVYRLYDANGHTVPPEIHSCLSQLYSNTTTIQANAAREKLSAVVGELEEGWPRWRSWHGWLKQSYAWIRFCPLCMRENNLHQLIWELPLVSVCPTHGTLLAEHCECGKRLGWRNVAPGWRCKCGKPFADFQAIRVSDGRLKLARLISACLAAEKEAGWSRKWRLPEEFLRLPLEELYAEIEFLHRLENKLNRPIRKGLEGKVPSTSTGMLLAGWPDSFDHLLRDWLENFFARRQKNSVVRLGRNMPLIRMMETPANLRTGLVMPMISWNRLHSFVASFRLPIKGGGVYLINPALAARITEDWLQQFFMETARKPKSGASANYQPSRVWSHHVTVMHQVIRLLVVCAATAGRFNDAAKSVARGWPPVAEFRGGTTLEWLEHLIEPLCFATYPHLHDLREALKPMVAVGTSVGVAV